MTRTSRKVLGLALALMLALLSAVPAMAANVYTTITGPASLKVTEKLYLEKADTTVPEVGFKIEVASAPVHQDDSAYDSSFYSGTPTVKTGTVEFAPTDLGSVADDGSGEDWARSVTKEYELDFSTVTFKRPGIYRYKITKSQTTVNSALTNLNASTKYVDIMVVDNSDGSGYKLKIEASVYANTNELGIARIAGGEAKAFADKYPAQGYDITLAKQVTGNQGLKDKYFSFTINLNKGVPGASYVLDYTNADAVADGTSQPAVITLGGSGTGSVTVKLMHNQSVKVKDVAHGMGYSVAESDNEGYTVTAAVTGADNKTNDETTPAAIALAGNIIADNYLQGAATITYTNEKTGTIPTGILMMAAPAIALAAAASIGIGVMAYVKKKDEDEE